MAEYAIFIFGLILIYLLRKDRKLFFKAAIATLITIAVVALIKKMWFFPRPFVDEKVKVLITHIPDSSFPSKHTAVAFALAFGIFLEKRRLGVWLLALAFLIAHSRVIAGVHYPRDILAGILIGMSIAGATQKLPFQKRKNPL